MHVRPAVFLLPIMLLFVLPAAAQVTPQEQNEGFVPMLNGTDLTGWVVQGGQGGWEMQDGVLACLGTGGGWLRTDAQYYDFVWRLEYKISPGGNSGLFLRATREGNPAFTGMELQILDDHGREPNAHSAMSLYGSRAPDENMSRPAGEWNAVEVSLIGRQLKVIWNGQQVHDVHLDDPDLPWQERKLTERAEVGYLGMQNYGVPVEFRNMRLKVIRGVEE